MLETLKRYLRYTSWPIIAAMLALMTIGILAIGMSEAVNPQLTGRAVRQVTFAGVGLVGFLVMTVIPYQRIGRAAYPFFALTLALLIVVLLLPAETSRRGGSARWIDLGLFAVQPSEITKLTYIILLGWYLRLGDHYRRLRGLLIPFALTFVPMLLILAEPDLGTALLFLPTLYFMLFMAGAKLRHLLLFVALGTVLVLFPTARRADSAPARAQARRRRRGR